MANERFTVALDHFARSLARLHESLEQPEDPFMRDSVIQRFEVTFETAWKAMYRWMRARDVDVDEDAHSVVPEGFKRRLIVNEKAWSDMRKFRNLTSHTYDEAKAIAVAAFVRADGVHLFEGLLDTLRKRAP